MRRDTANNLPRGASVPATVHTRDAQQTRFAPPTNNGGQALPKSQNALSVQLGSRAEESSKRARARPGGGGRGGGSKAALNNAAQPLPGAPQDSNKMRVTVYKAFGNGLPNTEQGKAVMVPDSWEEFLKEAGRKMNTARITRVETLESGTVLEELNEVMHGDKLVIRCAAEPSSDEGAQALNREDSGAEASGQLSGKNAVGVRVKSLQGRAEENAPTEDEMEDMRKNLLDLIGDELEGTNSNSSQALGTGGPSRGPGNGNGAPNVMSMFLQQRDIMAGRSLSVQAGAEQAAGGGGEAALDSTSTHTDVTHKGNSNLLPGSSSMLMPGNATAGLSGLQSLTVASLPFDNNVSSGRGRRQAQPAGMVQQQQHVTQQQQQQTQFQVQQMQQQQQQQHRFLMQGTTSSQGAVNNAPGVPFEQQQHRKQANQQQQMQRFLMMQQQVLPGHVTPLQFGVGGVSSAAIGGGGGVGGGAANLYGMTSAPGSSGMKTSMPPAMGQHMFLQHPSSFVDTSRMAGGAPFSAPYGPGGPQVQSINLPNGTMGVGGSASMAGGAGAIVAHSSFGRRSHEQARFSPLVQVLRDNMVATGSKEMDADQISQALAAIMPDYPTRLAISSVIDYVHEAVQAGLVQVERNGKQILASIRGNREMGVVKWVKESYGFIQSAAHAEDLFYHGSEVRSSRPLCATDEVEFLVVRNPFTGKLNATQIHLLHPHGVPKINLSQREGNPGSNSQQNGKSADGRVESPEIIERQPEEMQELNQLAQRMSAMGFSSTQIEDCMRSFHPGVCYVNDEGSPDASKAVEPNKEPWLFKTKMCKFWPSCPRGNKCWFAHGEEDLRKPNSVAYLFSTSGFGANGEPLPPGSQVQAQLEFEKEKQAIEIKLRQFHKDAGDTFDGRFTDFETLGGGAMGFRGGGDLSNLLGLQNSQNAAGQGWDMPSQHLQMMGNDPNNDWGMAGTFDFQPSLQEQSPGMLTAHEEESMFRPMEDHTDRIAKQQQKEQHQQMQQMQHQHQQQLLMHSDGGFGTLDAFSSGALFSYPGE